MDFFDEKNKIFPEHFLVLALISFKFKNKFNLNIFIKNSAKFLNFLIWNDVLTHNILNSKAKIQFYFQDTNFLSFFFHKFFLEMVIFGFLP
jgi:hypothetical protein